ncbi:NPP1 family protein [Halalkalibacterium halodurans]|uniref:NPP1 family protein n=1 Tax=Halalkalibacterium halodurans TaxID=86665 RepID=UPI002AA9FB0A|nr:NPP1 family protein [Halalkalibacterium halodurans]MDY7224348.1 NPP1 family protein [Halalkalibacterium halodurans]MDY7243633.1 NPP1 family protein [Halalkalibacterium halodurans]MED4123303.1 NPP1 family protein [Halalkalibacterium halodurans]MED4171976.1 NPP1 family protein [Halalkalibacterium halodurans]
MKRFVYVFLFSLLVSASLVSTADAAEVIPHNQVVGFNQVTPYNVTTRAEQRFQPYLKVAHGCVPFPAVNARGQVSGGLGTGGAHNGGCSSSKGQVYARSTWYNGVWAIMYAWYFPKDSPSPGLGHRHDWEGIVVWVDNPGSANPKVQAISYSQHGKFVKTPPHSWLMEGTHPKIRYDAPQWPLNHSLYVDSIRGGMQPVIGWNDLTSAARHSLNTHNFGAANVPFNDNNFWNNLNKAWYK